MSALSTTLDAIREAFSSKVPEATRDVMHRATESLIESGQADRALAPGSPLPAFETVTSAGSAVRSESLIGRGPLILTFFRGHW